MVPVQKEFLKELVTLLADGTLIDRLPPAHVLELFRNAFFKIHREYKGKYVTAVVDGHYMSHRELGELLGYGKKSGGAIKGAMEGKISEGKFDLLRGTVATQIKKEKSPHWPSPNEFAQLALIRVINPGGASGASASDPSDVFELEEYLCLEKFISRQWRDRVLESSQEAIERQVRAKLAKIHLLTDSRRIQTLPDVLRVLTRWGKLYRHCKSAIPGLSEGNKEEEDQEEGDQA